VLPAILEARLSDASASDPVSGVRTHRDREDGPIPASGAGAARGGETRRSGAWDLTGAVIFIAEVGGLTRFDTRQAHELTRIFSAYELRDGTRIWIITEAVRSKTTIQLPEEC
jgi:hypothetical protein